jgi:hypothetical protein
MMAIKSRRLSWTSHIARVEEERNAFKILRGKPTRRKLLGKSKRIREENVRMDLK